MIFDSILNESGNIISYSNSYKDVDEIMRSLPEKEHNHIWYGVYEDWHPLYREVLRVNGSPVAFIEIDRGSTKSKNKSTHLTCTLSIACKPDKKYRHKGYPTNLLKRGIEYAKLNEAIDRLVWIAAKENVESIGLAKKMGFKKSTELLYPKYTDDFVELEYKVNV